MKDNENINNSNESKKSRRNKIVYIFILCFSLIAMLIGATYSYEAYIAGTGNLDKYYSNTNVDTDGDGKPDINLDYNSNGIKVFNVDKNGDGKPEFNLINQDINNDGVCDINCDINNNGYPDINIDLNGDKIVDINIDTNNDNKADVNIDIDGDMEADINIDTDKDNKADVNIDIDGDKKPDLNVDYGNDRLAHFNIDSNKDNKADINLIDQTWSNGICKLNCDIDSNGFVEVNVDLNSDGKPDLNIDNKKNNEPLYNVDKDFDKIPDYNRMNLDTDKDDVCDYNCDTDGDGWPDTYINGYVPKSPSTPVAPDTSGDDENVIIDTQQPYSIIYNDTENIVVNDIEPGWSGVKKFTVNNPSKYSATYNILFTNVVNTFTKTNNIVYSIKLNGVTKLINSQVPYDNTVGVGILSNIIILPNTTHTYEMTFKFLETGVNQSIDSNKNFKARVKIEIAVD